MNTNENEMCKIEVFGNIKTKTINGKTIQYLTIQVSLQEDNIDEQHDLLYLVQSASHRDGVIKSEEKIPQCYKDLKEEYIIKISCTGVNIAQGKIKIHSIA